MLWTTLRAFDFKDDQWAARHCATLVGNSLEGGYADAKQIIDLPDFYETPIGLGFMWLDKSIRLNGVERKFRLGQLIRAEQIMLDAAQVMALQFERTLEVAGALPRPGLSSGNIEFWLP